MQPFVSDYSTRPRAGASHTLPYRTCPVCQWTRPEGSFLIRGGSSRCDRCGQRSRHVQYVGAGVR
jgi:hypothetical protein